LSAREREYVLAARAFGASDWYLLRRHLLPQLRGVLVAQAAVLIPQYILAEVTMSFLGLGVNEPGVSWGVMLGTLQEYSSFVGRWWLWIPAVLIVPFVFGYYSLALAIAGIDPGPAYNGPLLNSVEGDNHKSRSRLRKLRRPKD
jgi:peptide/nickel transport system permease protein